MSEMKDELAARRKATAEALTHIAERVASGDCAALILTAVNVEQPPDELAFNAGGMAELGLLMGLSRFTHAKVEQGVLLHEALRMAGGEPKEESDVPPAPAPNPFAPKAN